MDVDVTSFLPPDDSAYGFDNVADAQGSSPALLQAYLAAARKISTVAVGDLRIGLSSDTYSVRQDLSQDKHIDGLPLGTIGGLRARHTFPVDGEYDFQVRLYRTNLSAIRGLQDPHEIELTLDGERVLLAKVGGPDDLVAAPAEPDRHVGRHRSEAASAAAVREGRAAGRDGRSRRRGAGASSRRRGSSPSFATSRIPTRPRAPRTSSPSPFRDPTTGRRRPQRPVPPYSRAGRPRPPKSFPARV